MVDELPAARVERVKRWEVSEESGRGVYRLNLGFVNGEP